MRLRREMTKDEGNPNRGNSLTPQRFKDLTSAKQFAIRHSSFRVNDAFTLVELIVVITVIVILTGLVLSTVGYVQKKAARSRAETEIAAMSAACENYKADNGIYPRDTTNNTTDNLAALTSQTPPDPLPTSYDPSNAAYSAASSYLYGQLSGNVSRDRSTYSQKSYFQFKPNMLSPAGGTGTVTAIRDPFGNSYGYSTANQANSSYGFNPTFDLWSTGGTSNATTAAYEKAWIKNW
jgi:prepilin-type N-terminal cleavage/methylation domain-containing protein